jgi:hypothetical protein
MTDVDQSVGVDGLIDAGHLETACVSCVWIGCESSGYNWIR